MHSPDLQQQFEEFSRKIVHGPEMDQGNCYGIKYILDPHIEDEIRKRHIAQSTFGGTALAPTAAAMCLLDTVRTHQFARGLYSAIQQMLQTTKERPIRVLDVGCGPYGLLAMLVAPFFEEGEVEFTAMDIHQISVDCTKKIAEVLGQLGKFGGFIREDATTYQFEGQKFHIIVTELMRSLLQVEPQIAVTGMMGDQLTEGGLFLPEKIRIFTDIQDAEGALREAGEIFELTKDISSKLKKGGRIDSEALRHMQKVRANLEVGPLKEGEIFSVKTQIKVFGGINVEPDQSLGITNSSEAICPKDSRGGLAHVKFQMGDGDSENGARIFLPRF